MIKFLFSFCLASLPAVATAQDVEMADALYANGKIYVVVAVLFIIVAGLFAYLIYLDRKLSGHEKAKRS